MPGGTDLSSYLQEKLRQGNGCSGLKVWLSYRDFKTSAWLRIKTQKAPGGGGLSSTWEAQANGSL